MKSTGETVQQTVYFGRPVLARESLERAQFFDLVSIGVRTRIRRRVEVIVVGRCCTTLPVEDSHRESTRLDRLHEQAMKGCRSYGEAAVSYFTPDRYR